MRVTKLSAMNRYLKQIRCVVLKDECLRLKNDCYKIDLNALIKYQDHILCNVFNFMVKGINISS